MINRSGRNVSGKIVVRHRGCRLNWRFVSLDHFRTLLKLPAFVVSYVKLSVKKPYGALIKYLCGSISYIIAPVGLKVGCKLNSFFINLDKRNFRYAGSIIFLDCLKQNDIIYSYYTASKVRSFYARSAGTFCTLKYKTQSKDFFIVSMPSGELTKLPVNLRVFIGRNSNSLHKKEFLGSAGYTRRLGFRPTVRGVAMNPVDHPHGGRTKTSQPEVSPWGWVAKRGY